MSEFLWSCCGDNMKGTIWEDIQRCPTCHESCIGEEEYVVEECIEE